MAELWYRLTQLPDLTLNKYDYQEMVLIFRVNKNEYETSIQIGWDDIVISLGNEKNESHCRKSRKGKWALRVLPLQPLSPSLYPPFCALYIW